MKRRYSVEVNVGNLRIGGDNPIVIQSMTTTSTLDVAASADQVEELARAGAQLVRLTAQGVAQARKLAEIKSVVSSHGVDIPLVADIHFNAPAAFEAARHVEKVRINPGNFADPGRTFRKMTFSDEEYAAELRHIRSKVVPFISLCKEQGTAIRIGVNHGSLSDRIMSRYGDGVDGMVQSAMEFLRICVEQNFHNVVVSIKASDVPTMTTTVRALVNAMDAEDMHFPLHLGVTEAGNALEGRIKSAVGIGTLLMDGIGDTIRVSLSEDPCAEIPVAESLIRHITSNEDAYSMKRPLQMVSKRPDDPRILTSLDGMPNVVVADSGNRIAKVRDVARSGIPYAVKLCYGSDHTSDDAIIAAAVDLGYLLLEGDVQAVMLDIASLGVEKSADIARMIVQAVGLARFKAEIVACPGCGRTLFDLQQALNDVKKTCIHLRHLKIAVMGCIVNGPGEMAGADYGYVGAGTQRVSIYRGLEPVYRNIPQADAINRLVELIKADGQWRDPLQ